MCMFIWNREKQDVTIVIMFIWHGKICSIILNLSYVELDVLLLITAFKCQFL
jgi:hypothetical protein